MNHKALIFTDHTPNDAVCTNLIYEKCGLKDTQQHTVFKGLLTKSHVVLYDLDT